ncbi:MAG: glycosyltransferase [Taibaiella sp.]|nr:glycosyltransferase [Taibaiella sp.]
MKIIIIGPAHPLRGGGISTFNERLAQALQQQGHKVSIYSFSLQYPSFLFPGKSQFTEEAPPADITIHSIINSINPLNWIKTGNRIKKENADLVIVRYWLPFMGPALGTILRRIRKNRHTKILCIADNIVPHEHRPGDKAFTRYFIKPVDAFVTMSRDVLKDITQLTDKPAHFTPHPLYDNYGEPLPKDEACSKLGLDPALKYILFFGFIRKYKGLDILLEAMNDERLKQEHIQLIIAGEYYDDKMIYEELLQKHNLFSRVHLFTSFIPNEEVRYYFSAADLVVQPYRTATQSGITQVAYHFEKPMVVTNVGGLAEVVIDGKTGFVTQAEPKIIADAIYRFFQPGAIPHLQHNLQEQKKLYSWDNFIKKLFETARV